MKKLIAVIALFISLCSYGQIDSMVNKLIDAKLSTVTFTGTTTSFPALSDTIIRAKRSLAGSFIIDTLTIPNNSTIIYQLTLKGRSGTSRPSAKKTIVVSNDNGVYTLNRELNDAVFTGLTGASWAIKKLGNYLVVSITGTTAITEWNYQKNIF